MDWSDARSRFAHLADAFDADGGFAPRVVPGVDATGRSIQVLAGPSALVRYQRESDEKFAGRNALVTYENHLRSACARFIGFLGRRRPQRDGLDSPLPSLLAADADLRGNDLDSFWRTFAMAARARGSMLLLIDMPSDRPAITLADQMRRRAVPYLCAIPPERVEAYEIDNESGLFISVSIACLEVIGDKLQACTRDYTITGWALRVREHVVAQGEHAFGQCPVLAFTETGGDFPVLGKYEQIAALSRRVFNARSELDEILRAQTFSLLTLQVPLEERSLFDAAGIAATIGTHSMLVHSGQTPAFIAPDSGPAQTYQASIAALEQAIRRVSLDESAEAGASPESGLSRRLRFEALNAELSVFALTMQSLENRMWALFHRALGLRSSVSASWPSDYNLADVVAELDILALMQATGFPAEGLDAKRLAIAAIEFDNASEDTKAGITAAIIEGEQARTRDMAEDDPAADQVISSNAQPSDAPAPPDLSPITDQLTAMAGQIEALRAQPQPAPVINITVPEQPPANIAIHPPAITVEAPQVTVHPPSITVEAPQITVNPPAITVEAPTINVEAPAAAAAQAPQPITLNTGSGARVIDLVRDASGRVSGASVREA